MATLRGPEHLLFSSSRLRYLPRPPPFLLAYAHNERGRRSQTRGVLFAQMLHNTLEATVLTHKLQSRLGPNTFDRFQIVTAKEDTQVNEL